MQKVNDNIYALIILGIAGAILLTGGIVYFFISYVVKVSKQKEEMQQAELKHQAKLFTAIIESQEEERRRIGREMHDEAGSILSAVRLQMSAAEMNGETKMLYAENIKSIDKLIDIVRNVSHLLSPPELEFAGFHDAVESLCDSLMNNKTEIILQDEVPGFIPKNQFKISLSLYRILQELITNSIKHACSEVITIHIKNKEDIFIIEYGDDGRGYDNTIQKQQGIGIQSIQSRLVMINATYKIETAPDCGFKFFLYLNHRHIF